MNRIYLIVPTAAGVGSPDIAKALFEALKSKVSKIGCFDPLSQVKNLLQKEGIVGPYVVLVPGTRGEQKK